MNDNYDFEPDSGMGEDEQFAELDAFLMYLQELKNKPNMQIINPLRLKEFQYACRVITKAVKAENPDAQIEYKMNDGDAGEGVIRIVADEISARDLKGFISGLKLAHNFEVYPRTDGNIQMNILFHGLMVSKNLE